MGLHSGCCLSHFCDVKTLNTSFPASVCRCSVTRAQHRSVPLWLILLNTNTTLLKGGNKPELNAKKSLV